MSLQENRPQHYLVVSFTMFIGRQHNADIVALSERLGTVENTLTVIESTLGMNLPRVATLEHRCAGIVDKIGRLESRMDKDLQRRRMIDSPERAESEPPPSAPPMAEVMHSTVSLANVPSGVSDLRSQIATG